MTLRQYILRLGLVSTAMISTPVMTPSAQIIRPEGGPVGRPGEFDTDWSSTYTNWGHVASLETGWSDDTTSIVLDVPFVNSSRRLLGKLERCQPSGDYALDPKDPGIKVHEAALLSAFVAGNKVRLRISACAFSKPRITAVGLTN